MLNFLLNKLLLDFYLQLQNSPSAWCLRNITFYDGKLRIFVISQSVCPWQAFPAQSNVCCQGQPERCFTWVGSGLTHKHQTRLEKLGKDKRSSLLRKFVTYGRKKFYRIGPWPHSNVIFLGIEYHDWSFVPLSMPLGLLLSLGAMHQCAVIWPSDIRPCNN